jgi:AraC-like DNA-binding protein
LKSSCFCISILQLADLVNSSVAQRLQPTLGMVGVGVASLLEFIMATISDVENAIEAISMPFSWVQSFEESLSNSSISQAIQHMRNRSSVISRKLSMSRYNSPPMLPTPPKRAVPFVYEPAIDRMHCSVDWSQMGANVACHPHLEQPAPSKPARRRSRKRGNRVAIIGLLEQELKREAKSRIQIIEEAYNNGRTPDLPRLTQYELARRLNTSTATITRIFQSDSVRPLKILFNSLQHADSLLELRDNYLYNTH